jgi:hypothetical protein
MAEEVKVAVTVCAAVIGTTQVVPEPEHPPPAQVVNV